MNEIITLVGGTGFVGQYVVKLLAQEGYRVRVIARNPDAALPLKTAGDLGQVAVLPGNLNKIESITPHLAGSSAVINLVGIMFEGGAQKFNALHAQGTEKLAQAAKAAGVKTFVQISALGVDKATASTYARSKIMGEKAVRAAFPEAVILRPSVVFGPEDNFYNFFAKLGAMLHMLPLIGGGNTKFQPVYAGDVARAILACLQKPQVTQGKTYELAGPEIYSFKQILEYVRRTADLRAVLMPLPFGFAMLQGWGCEILGKVTPFRPLLTRDQVRLLKYDNVAGKDLPGFEALGIQPIAPELVVPDYLRRFTKHVYGLA